MPVPGTVSVSCAALSVTVCGADQLDGVNVSVAGLAVMSLSPDVATVTVTLELGWWLSRTVWGTASPSGMMCQMVDSTTVEVVNSASVASDVTSVAQVAPEYALKVYETPGESRMAFVVTVDLMQLPELGTVCLKYHAPVCPVIVSVAVL